MRALIPFLKLFRRQLKWMTIGTFLAFLAILASIGLLSLSGWFISATGFVATASIIVAHQFNYFYPAAGVRAFSVLRIVTRYGERVFTHEATFKLLTDIRLWIYNRLLPLAPSHLMEYKSGDLLSRLVNDVNQLDNLYIRIISPTIVLLLSILLIGVFFSFLSLSIALFTMGFAAFAGFVVPLISAQLAKKNANQLAQETAILKTAITQHIHSMAELKIFNADHSHAKEIHMQSKALIHSQQKMAFFSGFGSFLMTLALGAAIWVSLWISVSLVEAGKLNGAFIALFALGIMGLFEAIMPLPVAYQYLGQTLRSAKRILTLTQQKPSVVFPQSADKLELISKDNASITFNHVCFGYSPHTKVLQDFNLAIQAKEKIALFGPTGSGKSTIVNLLARFWNPESGEILIGKNNIKHFDEKSLYQNITIISQHSHIFNNTIKENLKIAKEDATDDELYHALDLVDLKDFVQSLPNQLNSWTGELGKHLSKGQMRRLTLARMLLSDAPIIVLDEPTEGFDKITEAKVINSIWTYLQDRTLILITHNQTLLNKVDRVVYL